MATISSGSVTITIQPGEQYRFIASGEAYLDIGGGSTESYRLINGSSERLLGGFIVATRVTIRVVSGSVEYRIEPNIAGYAGSDNNGGIYDADGNIVSFGTVPMYTGQVNRRTQAPNFKNSIPQLSSKFLLDPFTEDVGKGNPWRMRFPNVFINGSGNATPDWKEKGPGAASNIRVSIEEPPGVFTRVTFSGAATGTMQDKSILWSDDILVDIPAGKTDVPVWIYVTNPNGCVIWNVAMMAKPGEGFVASGATDLTESGGIIAQATTTMYGPDLVIATTTKKSYLSGGDSIDLGISSCTPYDGTGDCGLGVKGLPQNVAYAKIACGGDRSDLFLEDNAYRLSFLPYFTDFICGYGYNNINTTNGGKSKQTSLQVLSSLQSIVSLVKASGLRFWQRLITMSAISSNDFWTTTTNQTFVATDADRRAALNSMIIHGALTNIDGYFNPFVGIETGEETNKLVVETTGRTITDYTATQGSNFVASASGAFTEKDNYKRVRLLGYNTGGGAINAVMKYESATQISIWAVSHLGVLTASNCLNAGGVASGTGYIGISRYSNDGTHPYPEWESYVSGNNYQAKLY